ncbi:short-chain dehydrogenase/reductase SDR [mine drainage metagenome]|uniref:Short-chain dehydrogenase/reductase SDR n=1 Tax=mine drainage metagenome TaxID=410659 RepID=T1A8Q5_9ZZZZ
MNAETDPTPLLSPRYRLPEHALRGRVIAITGAGGGIGRAVSRALADQSATLVLLGPEIGTLASLHDEIVMAGGTAPILQAIDFRGATVSDYDDIGVALQTQFGHLDGLLHNAGILGYHGPVLNHPPEAWHEVIQVNLQAAFALTRACLPLLETAEDASVLFTTCEWARHPRAFSAAYGVAYAAIEMFMRILADEMEFRPNLRFNALDPGWVATSITESLFPGQPATHWPQPEAIVGAYLYLLGPESRGVTGRVFGIAPGHGNPSTREHGRA